MTDSQNTLPKWILIVSALFAIMEIGVSISICVAPQSVLENLDVTAKGVDYLAQMWAVRQFALGFIFAFATLRKSAPMLTTAFIFFLVMFVGDAVIGIVQKQNALVISALVMCAVSSAMLFAINKKN